jgi:hypothetical protein
MMALGRDRCHCDVGVQPRDLTSLTTAARSGFVDALGVAAIVAAAVALMTALFVARVMPATGVGP